MSYRSAAIAAAPTDWSAAIRGRPRVGHAIEVHAVIGSTSDRARELLDEPGGDGAVVVAELQHAGRGRRGRAWLSPAGVNLTVSVGLRLSLGAADAWQVGLAAALAALQACRHVVPAVSLKWPNDLVVDGRKVGGLLVETVVRGDRADAAVIGIGINVNWSRDDMPPEIGAIATSLRDVVGAPVDRVALLDRLLDALNAEVEGVVAGRSPLERYRAVCSTLGTDVRVTMPGKVVVGRASDIDATGSLVLDTAGGRVVVPTGEVEAVRRSDAE
jgi:BirA family transcriptional regulator, biotin operon repressor / biotin---[acetyl-CoA-carboxylase] ligase